MTNKSKKWLGTGSEFYFVALANFSGLIHLLPQTLKHNAATPAKRRYGNLCMQAITIHLLTEAIYLQYFYKQYNHHQRSVEALAPHKT
jgi:hypothetical protein